jgi:hypothetical protein
MMAFGPGTLMMKAKIDINAKMIDNVMDEEFVLIMVFQLDGAKGLQDQQRVQAIDTMKL